MTNLIKWTNDPNGIQTMMQAPLANLAAGGYATSSESSGVVSGGSFNNAIYLDLYANWQLGVAYSAVGSVAGQTVAQLFYLPSVDGSHFATTTPSGAPQQSMFIGAFQSESPGTGALEYMSLLGTPLPPLNFKAVIYNACPTGHFQATPSGSLQMLGYFVNANA